MKCRYPKCARNAAKGHTTCKRHYTAGRSTKQVTMQNRDATRKPKRTKVNDRKPKHGHWFYR